jgi:8-oxo-dGTP pyrophosphatase MutT (NUDIX family)
MDASNKNGIVEQSGVIPCRVRRGKVEVALVTTRDGHRWTIPKGHIEVGLSAQESAAKECLEEAGLIGSLHPRHVCVYWYEKRSATREVRVFLLLVEDEMAKWPEQNCRRRKWMSVDRAVMCVPNEQLRRGFRKVEQMLIGDVLAAAA